jgi:hypothetical protein
LSRNVDECKSLAAGFRAAAAAAALASTGAAWQEVPSRDVDYYMPQKGAPTLQDNASMIDKWYGGEG